MISSGRPTSVTLKDILSNITEAEILQYYLGISKIPCVICSPLRQDSKPSFGLFTLDGEHIFYTDLATKDNGGTFELLGKIWGLDFQQTLNRINSDFIQHTSVSVTKQTPVEVRHTGTSDDSKMECKVREWKDYDIQYWESYGVTLPWLKYADIYPISHKIIIKNGKKLVFGADKYAYAFVERKEGNITLKIYQPYNKDGYKWSNKHDRSVISLWTKIPKNGELVCICSSMKDALCLSCNLNIPAVAIQGEGYGMSTTAVNELKRRYKEVVICLDNDTAGLEDAEKLANQTGFKNIILPQVPNAKDISDIYKALGKEQFINTLKPLFYGEKNVISKD